ncbi:MAG: site-2 protease family protein [Actinomycetota bacterium]|jgi:membrane-associated protease RseP (regulator of RpoE activity)|nr:site-2 protease family protein [Actinomycetota bacterium]
MTARVTGEPGAGAPPVPDDGTAVTGGRGPVTSPRRALVQLVAGVAAAVVLAVATGHVDLLVVVVSLVVMVMVHELGHLLAAKHGRMKVTEYFLGFGPRLWSFRRGETEYGVKALPLGGYVKIPGMTNLEEVDPADEPRTYRQQPFHARLLVAVAGSAMHFLMAFVLLWSLFAFVGTPSATQVAIEGTATVGGRPGPAAKAGLRAGDVVVSVDGARVGGDASVLTTAIHDHAGKPVRLVVERDGVRRTVTVVPANGRTASEAGVALPSGTAPFGVIGVSLGAPLERVSPVPALGRTVTGIGRLTASSVTGVVSLFSPNAIGQRFKQVTSAKAAAQASANGTRVESIVGAVNTAAQAFHAGVGNLLAFLVAINLFIGVFNLFPMLPLDGGHVAIAVYERLRSLGRRRPYHADVAKLMPLTWVMLAFLGVLFATSLVNDLLHPLPNPFG